MNKISKTINIIGIIAATIAVILITAILIAMPDPYEDVIEGNFDLDDEWYQRIIEDYADTGKYKESQRDYLGAIGSAKKAKKEAEKEWFKVYGILNTIRERPYMAYYDAGNGVWLVCGSLPEGYVGGTAHILIRGEDGKVLALWHEA